jgi:thiol-disulfide isomerase/thioredoxin
MNLNIIIFLTILTCPSASQAQDINPKLINIGDPAPPVKVGEWIKGTPIKEFEKGKIYVVEFWATWCRPCIAVMPELSDLAKKYKDKISIVAVDILENKSINKNRIYDFVDSMGKRMNYHVGMDDNQNMETSWYNATAEPGIPKTFLINDEGIICWIGNPKDLAQVLPKVVSHGWNIPEALAKRNMEKRLKDQDYEASYRLREYLTNGINCDTYGNPDSALLIIKDIVAKDPNMQFTPIIALNTFTALLKKDQEKAYEYGSRAIETSTYTDPPYGIVISVLKNFQEVPLLPKISTYLVLIAIKK